MEIDQITNFNVSSSILDKIHDIKLPDIHKDNCVLWKPTEYIYEGHAKNGTGTIRYCKNDENIVQISGEFIDTVINGPATIQYKNGDSLSVDYNKGVKNGRSVKYCDHGQTKEILYWDNDLLINKIEFKYKDGDICEIIYVLKIPYDPKMYKFNFHGNVIERWQLNSENIYYKTGVIFLINSGNGHDIVSKDNDDNKLIKNLLVQLENNKYDNIEQILQSDKYFLTIDSSTFVTDYEINKKSKYTGKIMINKEWNVQMHDENGNLKIKHISVIGEFINNKFTKGSINGEYTTINGSFDNLDISKNTKIIKRAVKHILSANIVCIEWWVIENSQTNKQYYITIDCKKINDVSHGSLWEGTIRYNDEIYHGKFYMDYCVVEFVGYGKIYNKNTGKIVYEGEWEKNKPFSETNYTKYHENGAIAELNYITNGSNQVKKLIFDQHGKLVNPENNNDSESDNCPEIRSISRSSESESLNSW